MAGKRQVLAEAAPSQVREDQPLVARWIGAFGWGAVLLGIVIVSFNIYVRLSALSEEWGWLLILVGIILALVHAAIETDGMIRRYTAIAGVAGMACGLLGGIVLASQHKTWGVGLIPFFPGMVLIALFARREEDPFWKNLAVYILGGAGVAGALLGVIFVGFGVPWSENLGYVLLLIGAAALPMYFGLANASDKNTYFSAIGLIAFGIALIIVTVVRAIIPDLMYDWRAPAPQYAMPAALVGATMLAIGLLAWLVFPRYAGSASADSIRLIKSLGRISVMSGAMLAIIGVARLVATDMLRESGWFKTQPPQFIVPNGVVFVVVGLFCAGLGFIQSSENTLVVMIRREFTAFFVSPIAYLVLIGFTVIGAGSYFWFIITLIRRAALNRPLEEPFVGEFFLDAVPIIAVVFGIPFLTMRLLSEERRTGTLEVLLTAPVSEVQVIVSKFIACWVFFLMLWGPWFSFLIALRMEAGKPFDFHPLVGYALALAVSGANFVALGLFFSSLTRNQIISAVLTFMGLMMYLLLFIGSKLLQSEKGLLDVLSEVFRVMGFVDMWRETWSGKLWLRDIVYHLSATVFWLFLGVKVLEARRWT